MEPILRFLCSGDFQAHNWRQFSFIRSNGQNSRLYNILCVFDLIKLEAKRRGIKKVFLNGDIFEESDYHLTEVFNAVYKKIEELNDSGLDVVMNLGNHDIFRINDDKLLHTLVPFRSIANVVEAPTLVWKHLYVVPYMPARSIKEAIGKADPKNTMILGCHAGVQGARAGPKQYLVRNPLKLKDLRPDKWKLILLSDYHTTQYLRDNVLYLGSPVQHTFGETHSPGFWDVTLYREKPWYKLKRIKTNLPRFIAMDISSMQELEDAKEKLKGNYVSVTLSSTGLEGEIEAFARENGFSVRIKHSEEAKGPDSKRTSLRAISPSEHIRIYARRCAGRRHRARLVKLGQALYEGKAEEA